MIAFYMIKNQKTISDFLTEHKESKPDKIFIVDLINKESIDFKSFNSYVNSTCGFLLSQGLKKGDKLSVVLKNSLEYLLLITASLRMGVIFCPFPEFLTVSEIKRDLNFINPALLIVERDRREEFSPLFPFPVISLKPGVSLQKYKNDNSAVLSGPESPDDLACIYYSGGGKDEPRSIKYTHRNILSLIHSINRDYLFNESSTHLLVIPLSHTAALNYTFFPMLFIGGSIVLSKDFWTIRDEFWNIINQYKVSYTQVVPSILRMLSQQKKYTVKSGEMQFIGCGSAPLDPELQVMFEEKFNLPVANLYGLSETGPTHVDLPKRKNWKRGGIGKPLSVNNIILIDKDGNECKRGKTGEIAVKGDNVFPGYFINSHLTSHFFKNGYFMTGDIAFMDEDGNYFFKGRKKNIIIKGGYNIYPKEIDDVLTLHPDVISSETHGKNDYFLGEIIESDVIIRHGSKLSERELKDFCVPYLAFLKIPDIINLSPDNKK